MGRTARYSCTRASSMSASYCSSSSSLTERRSPPRHRRAGGGGGTPSRAVGPPFFDLGRLAHPVAQVIELRSPDIAEGGDLELGDGGRVDWEGPLDTDTEAHLAHREGLPDPRALAADDDALEHLDALAGAFDDPHVHLDRVPRPELGDVVAQALAVDDLSGVHAGPSALSARRGAGIEPGLRQNRRKCRGVGAVYPSDSGTPDKSDHE